jgi:hypothetical protein
LALSNQSHDTASLERKRLVRVLEDGRKPQLGDVYLVRVITDDREHQIWAVAAPREEAVDLVLDAIPEGWAASLLTNKLKPK